jgi:antitoxin MazE
MVHSAPFRMGQRGQVTIPRNLREGLDASTLFVAVRRDDGVIELRPQTTVDASHAWFWTERWQRMEREADEDIARGRVRRFNNVDEFLADLGE